MLVELLKKKYLMSVVSNLTVERFDPRVGTWEHIAPMSNPKFAAGAAVLDGKIYVSGGSNESDYLNTVEMFVCI